MVSHCVPSAVGTIDRVRAWQLLKLAVHTHTVRLVCTHDGPVNLSQWRTVDRQVQHFIIGNTQRHPQRRWWARWSGKPRTETHVNNNAKILQQLQSHRCEAIVCTHPSLWSDVRTLEATRRVCDLYPYRHTHQPLPSIQRIAEEVDLFILDRGDNRHGLPDRAYPTVVLPNRIDPVFFSHAHASQITRRYARPGLDLVLHSQWHRGDCDPLMAWFRRRVWPSIEKAVPQARLRHTQPGRSDPLLTLSDASVIVCPEKDPERARLSVLQAMAMQRPVIALGHAPETLGASVHHDQQLMIVEQPQDWIRHGVGLLSSASKRLRLSRNAGSWINRYTPIEQAGQALTHALSGHATDGHSPVNQAA